MPKTSRTERAVMNFRAPVTLKRDVETYADDHGISMAAAAVVLMGNALRAEGRLTGGTPAAETTTQ